nr:RNA-directed DNA polymerase, eukaryota [Tanacetum cinerariifolium]
EKFKRLFNLELQKDANVASKLQASNVASSFRRPPRSGIANSQFIELGQILSSISLSSVSDRWSWTLHGLGDFSVKLAREEIDKHVLVVSPSQNRWSKVLLIKLNVFLWRMMLDRLPTRSNLHNRGINITCILCPNCGAAIENRNHLFFGCTMSVDLARLIGRWWNIHIPIFDDPSSWDSWLNDVIRNTVSISDAIPFNTFGVDKIGGPSYLRTLSSKLDCCFFVLGLRSFAKLHDDRDLMGHVVMILQLAKVKYFNEKPFLSNVMYSTKLYINDDIPETAAFKQRYIRYTVNMDGHNWHARDVEDMPRKSMVVNPHPAAIESDGGDFGSEKRTIIDLDNYDEEEAKAKIVNKVVQVKVEPKD